jgi:polyhydroxyalkanoate synthesis regulator phasin
MTKYIQTDEQFRENVLASLRSILPHKMKNTTENGHAMDKRIAKLAGEGRDASVELMRLALAQLVQEGKIEFEEGTEPTKLDHSPARKSSVLADMRSNHDLQEKIAAEKDATEAKKILEGTKALIAGATVQAVLGGRVNHADSARLRESLTKLFDSLVKKKSMTLAWAREIDATIRAARWSTK